MDKGKDGSLSRAELEGWEMRLENESDQLLGWHDLDEKGWITREEFAESFASWAATVKVVMDDTPQRYQKLQLEDIDGDLNIEDLNPKIQRKLITAARRLEAKGSKGTGEGTADYGSENDEGATGVAAEL